jgi:hypothetical protein
MIKKILNIGFSLELDSTLKKFHNDESGGMMLSAGSHYK